MKVWKKFLLGMLVVFVLGIAVIVWMIVTAPKENAADVARHYNATILMSSNEIMQSASENLEDELKWYDSVEEAAQDGSKFESQRYKDYMFKNEFFRLELNGKLIVFYTIPNGANEKQELIAYIVFEHANEKVSQPYKKRGSLPVPGWGDSSYYFECDSAVVDYIILEMFSYRVLEEQGIQMFFGSWKDKEELESLTLAGMPLQILEEPLIMNGETYYFWYLTDISWLDRFSDIQWSSFTYRQIIEALDIQYTPTETK